MTVPQLPLTRIVPVIAHAVGVFGDEHKASHWLSIAYPWKDPLRSTRRTSMARVPGGIGSLGIGHLYIGSRRHVNQGAA